MKIDKLDLPEIFHLTPEFKEDERGYFSRTFCTNELSAIIPGFLPVQLNLSFNTVEHTLRGMHFQVHPYEEAKIVQCLQGSLFDVAVDLRTKSSTYKKWVGQVLTETKKDMLYIPRGFAHGFLTLEPNTLIQYFMSTPHVSESSSGIRYDDPSIGINWPFDPKVISKKDLNWSTL
jgi:dTDP-4-dehydrorhamnose 3,5-epimerase